MDYHTSIGGSGNIAAAREIQVGRFSPTVNVNLNLNLAGQGDLVILAPSFTFASPVFGGKVAHVDETGARRVPGVQQVVVLDDLVAVVGDHMWAAKKGLNALQIEWDDGQNAAVSSAQILDQIRAASERDGVVAKSVGDISKALSSNRLDATYHGGVLPNGDYVLVDEDGGVARVRS